MSFAAVVAMAVAFTACAAKTISDSALAQPTPAFTGSVPVFEGPYAAEFEEHYASTTSDFVRQVLEDGRIVDAEYAEMTNVLTACLADQGITFNGFEPEGGFSTSIAPNGGDTHAIVVECTRASGEDSIGAIYSWMKTNPENLDNATIMAECLVRAAVVPQDYSADEFSQDSAGRFADFETLSPDLQEALVSCSSDPLGLLD